MEKNLLPITTGETAIALKVADLKVIMNTERKNLFANGAAKNFYLLVMMCVFAHLRAEISAVIIKISVLLPNRRCAQTYL